MSRIMLQETTERNINDTHRHIKLFLNAFVKFEDSFPTNKPTETKPKQKKRKKESKKSSAAITLPNMSVLESMSNEHTSNLNHNSKKQNMKGTLLIIY